MWKTHKCVSGQQSEANDVTPTDKVNGRSSPGSNIVIGEYDGFTVHDITESDTDEKKIKFNDRY